jgi:hypothetical protein
MAKVLKLAIELEGHPEAERILANVVRQLDRVEKKAKIAEASANAFEAAYIRSTRAVDALGVAHVRTRLDETFGLVDRKTKSAAESAGVFQREYARASRELDQFAGVTVKIPPVLDRTTLSTNRLIMATGQLTNAAVLFSAGSAPGPIMIASLGRLAASGGPVAAAFVAIGAAAASSAALVKSSITEYVTASGMLDDHRHSLDNVSQAWRDFKFMIGEAIVGRGANLTGELDIMATAIRTFGAVVAIEAEKVAGPWRWLLGIGTTGAHAHMGHFKGADINLTGGFKDPHLSSGVPLLQPDRPLMDADTRAAIDRLIERRRGPKPLGASSFLPSFAAAQGSGAPDILATQQALTAADVEAQLEAQNDAFLREQEQLFDEQTRMLDEMAKSSVDTHGQMTTTMSGQWDAYGAHAQQVLSGVIGMTKDQVKAYYDSLAQAGIIQFGGLPPGITAHGNPGGPVRLPSFQHGGIIDAGAGMTMTARFHGRELITPLDRPGGGGLATIGPITINVVAGAGQNAREVAAAVKDEIVQMMSRHLPGRG